MKNFEYSLAIDGEVVRTLVTYLYPGEFWIELLDSEFKGRAVSPHIMYMLLGARRFISNENTFTDIGVEYANGYIKNLLIARDIFLKNKVEISNAIESTIRLYFAEYELNWRELKKIYESRSRMKHLFKTNVLTEKDYKLIKKILDDKIDNIKQSNNRTKFDLLNDSLKLIEDIKPLYTNVGNPIKKQCNPILSAIKSHCGAFIYDTIKLEEERILNIAKKNNSNYSAIPMRVFH